MLLPRLTIRQQPAAVAVAVLPVCSVRMMVTGTVDKLLAIAHRGSADVVTTEDVQCCG